MQFPCIAGSVALANKRGGNKYRATPVELERAERCLQRLLKAHPHLTEASCDALLGGPVTAEDAISLSYNDSVGMQSANDAAGGLGKTAN